MAKAETEESFRRCDCTLARVYLERKTTLDDSNNTSQHTIRSCSLPTELLRHQTIVVYAIEELLQVEVHDVLGPTEHSRARDTGA